MEDGSHAGTLALSRGLAEGADREQLPARWSQPQGAVSASYEEAAGARGHATRLRVENRRLLEEVRRLQRERGAH